MPVSLILYNGKYFVWHIRIRNSNNSSSIQGVGEMLLLHARGSGFDPQQRKRKEKKSTSSACCPQHTDLLPHSDSGPRPCLPSWRLQTHGGHGECLVNGPRGKAEVPGYSEGSESQPTRPPGLLQVPLLPLATNGRRLDVFWWLFVKSFYWWGWGWGWHVAGFTHKIQRTSLWNQSLPPRLCG